MVNVAISYCYAECHYDECHVIMLSGVMLNVVAPPHKSLLDWSLCHGVGVMKPGQIFPCFYLSKIRIFKTKLDLMQFSDLQILRPRGPVLQNFFAAVIKGSFTRNSQNQSDFGCPTDFARLSVRFL